MYLSILLLLPLLPVSQDTASTVQFLKRCLQPDGSYRNDPAQATSANLVSTSAALRALKHWHGEPRHMDKTKEYVWACYDKATGQFKDAPHGKPSYRTTAVGVMAVVTLGERFSPADLSRVQQALYQSDQPEEIRLGAGALEALVVDGQLKQVPAEWQTKLRRVFKGTLQSDGFYGTGTAQPLMTAGYSAAFLRLGYPLTNKAELVTLLKQAQHNMGGWTNGKGEVDLEASYRVMRCLYLLQCKDKAVLAHVAQFVASLKQPDGGYAMPGTRNATVAATYFAGSLQHWVHELRR